MDIRDNPKYIIIPFNISNIDDSAITSTEAGIMSVKAISTICARNGYTDKTSVVTTDNNCPICGTEQKTMLNKVSHLKSNDCFNIFFDDVDDKMQYATILETVTLILTRVKIS